MSAHAAATGPRPEVRCGAYADSGARTRAHVAVRLATCPFEGIEALVPDRGTVLDVGCGHGLLSILLARRSPGRTVVGVDVDASKLAAARLAASRAGVSDRVHFEQVAPAWLPPPASVDSVVIVDVLYLLGERRRAELLDAAVRATSGGTVVVKEMADRPRWKRALTVAQERVSVQVLGLTSGERVSLPHEAELVAPLVRAGASVRTVGLGRRRLHPHLAIVAHGAA